MCKSPPLSKGDLGGFLAAQKLRNALSYVRFYYSSARHLFAGCGDCLSCLIFLSRILL